MAEADGAAAQDGQDHTPELAQQSLEFALGARTAAPGEDTEQLEKSFDEDGDGSDASEPGASKQGARGGKSPPARPGPYLLPPLP